MNNKIAAAFLAALSAGLMAHAAAADPAAAATARSVIVANTAALPAKTSDVNNPAFLPFQATLSPHSSTKNTATDSFTVPAGKRLVIEYTSGQAQDLSGGAALFTIYTTAGGTGASYIVYVNKNDGNAVNQTTRIYADPGSVVQGFSANASPAQSTGGVITLSGYLVNVALP